MQGALQCAFPEMTERKAVRLSEILRGKGRGGEEASEENQVAFISWQSRTCDAVVNLTRQVPSEAEWLQQLETYKYEAELPEHLFDHERVQSLTLLDLKEFAFVKLPECEQFGSVTSSFPRYSPWFCSPFVQLCCHVHEFV